MKKSILLFLACIFAFTCVNAQTVFAPLGAKWHYYYEPDLTPVGDNYLKWEVEKDTIIEAKTCSKIIGKRISFDRINDEYDTTEQMPVFCYTSGDTIYYYNNEFNRFSRFINLDAKVNDTLTLLVPFRISWSTDTTFTLAVESIDTIILDGIALRRFYFMPTSTLDLFSLRVFVERIGNIIDISPLSYVPTFKHPDQRRLRCYVDDEIDTNTYWVGDCDFINPLNIREQTINNDLKVFPNPANDEVNISISKKHFKGTITLHNVISGVAVNQQVLDYNTKISVKNLPQGMYIISLMEHYTDKMIYFKTPLIISH